MTRKVLTHGNYSSTIKAILDNAQKPAFRIHLTTKAREKRASAILRHKIAPGLARLMAMEEIKRNPNMRKEIKDANLPRLVIDSNGNLIATDERIHGGIAVAPSRARLKSLKGRHKWKVEEDSVRDWAQHKPPLSSIAKGKAPFAPLMVAVEQQAHPRLGKQAVKTKRIMGFDDKFLVVQDYPKVNSVTRKFDDVVQSKFKQKDIAEIKTRPSPRTVAGEYKDVRLILTMSSGNKVHFIVDKGFAGKVLKWYNRE